MMKKRLKVQINEEYIFVEQATNKEITRYLDHHIHGDKVYGSSQGLGEGSGGLLFDGYGVSIFQDKTVQEKGHTTLWVYLLNY